MERQLFRTEAMEARTGIHGEVALAPPLSWQILGGFLFSTVLGAGVFLFTSSYAQTTMVAGEIASDLGVARVSPPRSGYLDAILVRNGDLVRKGQPIAVVSASSGSSSLEARRASAMDERLRIISGQRSLLDAASRAEISKLDAHVRGDESEMEAIAAQIASQEALVSSSRTDMEKVEPLLQRGFLSPKEMRARRDALTLREQELARLRQSYASKRADAAESRAESARLKAQLSVDLARLDDTRASVDRDSADGSNQRTETLFAPAAGRVTGISSHAGDPAPTDRPIMAIVPPGSRMEAVIRVPPQSIGLIEAGQQVRVSVDAFPEETYGTIAGRLREISATTVPLPGPDGAREFFVGRVDLSSQGISSYGTVRVLRPGMTVRTRIRTRTKSLVQWMFDPLYAVARR